MLTKRALIILALALLLVGAIFMRGRGRTLASADTEAELRDLVVTGAGVFWIQASRQPGQAPAELRYARHSGGRVLCLLREWDIRSLCVDGRKLYALIETGPEPDAGQLLIRDLRTGEEQRSGGLHRPQGIWAGRDQMVWAEARDARAEGIVHVPIIRPVHAIRVDCRPPEHSQLLTLTEGSDPHFGGRLLGECGTSFYWQENVGSEFSEGFTMVRRGYPGEDPETLVRTRGTNSSALIGDRLWWTTYSEEKGRPADGRAARTMKVQDDEPHTVTDWLPSRGRLCVAGSSVYDAGNGWLWKIPHELSEPIPVARCSFTYPPRASVWGANLYAFEPRGDETFLVRRPLGALGVVRAALSFGGISGKKAGAL